MTSYVLHHRLSARAERSPDGLAIAMADDTLTYAEAEAAANRLAALLRQLGTVDGDRIALVCPKSPATVVAMLACLKVGALYVPIDTATPPARIALILRAVEARAIFSVPEAVELLDALAAEGVVDAATPIISLEADEIVGDAVRSVASRTDWAMLDASPVDLAVSDDHAAHVLFTSGSTGVPKGVVITHANVATFVDWAVRYFGIGPDDRLSGHTPFHFDLSTLDIYGTITSGASLHLVPAQTSIVPQRMAAFIRDTALTQWFSVPSVLSYLAKFDTVADGDFPDLRRVMWCGEVLPVPTLIHWMQRLPHVQFTNLYGPTEATIASSYYTMPECPRSETEQVPIGVACDGEELVVLDGGVEADPKATGEIHIGGVGLSPGYWRDPEKTASVFVADPRPGREGERLYRTGDLGWRDEDDVVHFIGRADTQVKTRGYRVELGEIEVALDSIDALRESAVVGVTSEGFEGTAICCAYVSGEHEVGPADIRAALAKRVPNYMIPSRWQGFDALPRNANGKVDRPHLRQMFEQQAR
jgi:amino acid adenylation domain-containing protein